MIMHQKLGSTVVRLALTALSCAALLWPYTGAQAEMRLRFGTPFTTGSNLHKGMEKFAEVVGRESKGDIKVQVYADSQIGDIQQLITAMQLGTVDLAYLGVGNAAQLKGCGVLNVSYTPYLFKDRGHAQRVLNSPMFMEFYDACAKQAGLRIFAVAGARSPRALQTTKGPIRKPEDLKGMRLRIPPVDMFRATFEALGVKVVPMGLSEVYMALSRGQVEGQDNGFDLSLNFRWEEVAKFYSATDHVWDHAAWYVSEKRWQQMTPAQRELLIRAAQAGGQLATQVGEEFDGHGLERLKKAGSTYTVPDIAAFKAALKDVHKPYEGKVWPAGLVDKIRAMP